MPFVAAGVAARWAARAAKHAGEQAEYARNQSEIAAAQLALTEQLVDLARADATREREQAQRTHLLALRSRLDQRAPSIYAVARPGAGDEPLLSYIDRGSLPAEPHLGTAWRPADAPREVRNDSNEAYRVTLTIELVNLTCRADPNSTLVSVACQTARTLRAHRRRHMATPQSSHVCSVWLKALANPGDRIVSATWRTLVKQTLKPGLTARMEYLVPAERTVPHLLPESAEFAELPQVLATGYLVGILEWACIRALAGHLEDGEQTLGVHVDVSHEAPTPPGAKLTVDVQLTEVAGRQMAFAVQARDEAAVVARGTHRRTVIDRARFDTRLGAHPANTAVDTGRRA